VFKTLDSYPMEPIGLDGKKHESKNPRSASNRIGRCSIASGDIACVRRKPSSRTHQPFGPYTRDRAMHVYSPNLTSNTSIRPSQRRTCWSVISLSPNAPYSITVGKQSSIAWPLLSRTFFLPI